MFCVCCVICNSKNKTFLCNLDFLNVLGAARDLFGEKCGYAS